VVDADLERCEQPDELILFAYSSGRDKKAVIRGGLGTAMILGGRSDLVDLYWPVPGPLEAVDRWSGYGSDVVALRVKVRPFASAVVPGCVLGALVSDFFVAPHLSKEVGLYALSGILVASIIVLGFVFKVLAELVVRRRTARLDEDSAVAIVLDHLRRGMAKNPALARLLLKGMRDSIVAFTSARVT
jgi:hypothetical protein